MRIGMEKTAKKVADILAEDDAIIVYVDEKMVFCKLTDEDEFKFSLDGNYLDAYTIFEKLEKRENDSE